MATLACSCWRTLLSLAFACAPALAQTNFDRPGGDYLSAPVTSGDPADCALICERDRRCRSWSFSYPTDIDQRRGVLAQEHGAAAGPGQLLRLRRARRRRGRAANGAVETSIDRLGGDYSNFELKDGEGDEACKAACTADNKCRAWTYARPGYAGKEAHCFLKKDIKPPRRKAGFTSGVVR